MERAIVDAHCTTSRDKWAIVSITINDSKWRSRELSTVQYEEDTEEPWEFYVTSCTRLVRVHLQIADNQTVAHYEVSLAEKHGCYVYVWATCAEFQISKVVQRDCPHN